MERQNSLRLSIDTLVPPVPCSRHRGFLDLDASRSECWVCYDSERTDAGPMIFPCQCKGDVAAVHHDCLKRWLIESSVDSGEDNRKCKVCGEEYKLATGRAWLPSGLTVRHWVQTTVILSMMIGAPIGVYMVCLSSIPPACKILVIGLAVVLEYVCLR
ncbi:E3 ubiquitin-protein ligase MARCH9-like [Orbicella faveolata]|uniref:E3 ubiquitin-protein ligase MARCH9-like n=1 Tax=Orbicella faveolata TaxID=48498 RepID=UPI0009E1927C|nr:E3 ubiquitin-protein ligase MARCH9-like [Orbicella faveolata]